MVDIHNQPNQFIGSFDSEEKKWPVWARILFLGVTTLASWTGLYFAAKAIF